MENLVEILIWTAVCFTSGALPLSLWLGRLALGVDIRDYGDGNPGAFNVWRAGGKYWGLTAIFLDGFKALIPVAIAVHGVGIDGWGLTAVAVAPVFGHAYSPFLRFNGGKALAVTFGAWAGVTIWWGPTVLGIAFAMWLKLLKVDSWAVLFGLLTLLAAAFAMQPTGPILLMWVIIFGVVMWKHRAELGERPWQAAKET